MNKIIPLLLLLASLSFAQVYHDRTTTTSGTVSEPLGVYTLSFTHNTTTNASRLILVSITDTYPGGVICDGSVYIENITYDGVLLSLVAGTGFDETWGLVAPNTGVKTVVITWYLDPYCEMNLIAGASTYYNVSQTTPYGGVNTSYGTSNKMINYIRGNDTAGLLYDSVFAYVGTSLTITPVSPQVQQWNIQMGTSIGRFKGGSSRKAVAYVGLNSMNWTLSNVKSWWSIAFRINPETASAAAPARRSIIPILPEDDSPNTLLVMGAMGTFLLLGLIVIRKRTESKSS